MMELLLRVVGFEFDRPPVVLEVNGLRVDAAFQRAERQRWVPQAGTGPFNGQGFVGKELSPRPNAGVVRIAALGDSCTQFGNPSYPELAVELLRSELGIEAEALNGGVAGYSTVQGLDRFTKDVAPYAPHIVTVFFGWNDHWRWRSLTDSRATRTSAQPLDLLRPLRGSRIVQGVELLADTIAQGRSQRDNGEPVVRVPIEEYEANLTLLVGEIRRREAIPVLITAPTDLDPDNLDSDSLAKLATGFEMHDEYVAVTRRVADTEAVALIDPVPLFLGRTEYFTEDHIHFTPEGTRRLAELIAQDLGQLLQSAPRSSSPASDAPRP